MLVWCTERGKFFLAFWPMKTYTFSTDKEYVLGGYFPNFSRFSRLFLLLLRLLLDNRGHHLHRHVSSRLYPSLPVSPNRDESIDSYDLRLCLLNDLHHRPLRLPTIDYVIDDEYAVRFLDRIPRNEQAQHNSSLWRHENFLDKLPHSNLSLLLGDKQSHAEPVSEESCERYSVNRRSHDLCNSLSSKLAHCMLDGSFHQHRVSYDGGVVEISSVVKVNSF